MTDPVIGILLDYQNGSDGGYSTRPYYALRTDYFDAVRAAGGEPIGLDYEGNAERKLNRLDGYLTPGGEFDSPSEWYLDPLEARPFAHSPRLNVDLALIDAAHRRGMPILGACAGMQLMAGLHGARMVPNVGKHFNIASGVHQFKPREALAHNVVILSGSRLHAIIGADTLRVNSNHREAVVQSSPDITVAATRDGVIEAIELKGSFALGVQWHPELAAMGDPSRKIFDVFVDEARRFQLRHA